MVELAFITLLLVVVVLQTLTLYQMRQAPAPPRERDLLVPEEPEDDGEPTALNVLQHHHRFGPKDTSGVRYCRCGDRYLDGMRV